MTGRRVLLFAGAITAAAGSLAGPAAADWLVTRGGEAVETRGAWEVKGRLVLFHTAGGTYSSLRLDDVDLEASRSRTEAAAAAKRAKPRLPEAPPPRAKAKFVLTDDDVGHVDPSLFPNPVSDPAADGESAETAEGEFSAADENPLQVVSWDASAAGDDGVTISGVLGNPTDLHAANIAVRVTILNLADEVIGQAPATMAVNALAPGDQIAFQASFSGVFSVGAARFDVTSFNAVIPDRDEEPDGEALGI